MDKEKVLKMVRCKEELPQEYMDRPTVARFCGVSVDSVQKWQEEGDEAGRLLPSFQITRRGKVLSAVADVRAYIEMHRRDML